MSMLVLMLWSPDQPFLDASFPLPLGRPFTRAEALAHGIDDRQLRRLTELSLLRKMVRGVYVASHMPDSALLRAAALRLVVPDGVVITDWTACWLWTGIDAPGAHQRPPELYLFHSKPHSRMRNELAHSGARHFSRSDVTTFHGLAVTTPLRTACDLGRLFHRDRAIGGIDALLRLGTFDHPELLAEVPRFKGARGVVQLRHLAPLADARAESPGESTLRLRWLDETELPRPTPQIPIVVDGVVVFWIDLGVEELGYGCEYDGEEFHGPEQEGHDRARRADLRQRFDWDVDAARRKNVFGPTRDIEEMLHSGVRRARARRGQNPWTQGT